ncbi:HepT-like ribonuclease domain-containing protein [Myceligenerans indicum]|uniref:HepT-like ribonuclease domain-containing protein n=1 Tax=Myceligenerans indicum TaxID=2593663 RepID=UPI0027DE5DAF|nr:HepT-like ribonuclease domain-containing protein [Myceligenerans indicum]
MQKLPATYKDAHEGVDWLGISRMRNLIAHHYDRVDDRLVFSALASRIPELLDSLGISETPR